MRKRSIVVVAGLAAAALAGLPYGFGLQAQKAFARATDRGGRATGIRITKADYQRGWLTSTATMTLTLPGVPFALQLTHRIDHGPLPISRWLEGNFHWAPIGAMVRSSGVVVRPGTNGMTASTDLALITGETVVALNGEGKSVFDVRDVVVAQHGEDRHGRGTVQFSADLKRLQTDVEFANVVVQSEALAEQGLTALSATNIRFQSDWSERASGLWVGTNTLTLGELAAPPMLALRSVRLRSVSRAHGDEVDITSHHEIADVAFAGERLGALQMEVAVKRLSTKTLGELDEIIGGLSRADAAAEQLTMEVLGKAINLLARLSKTAPEMEIRNFVFRSTWGDIKGGARFVLDGRKINAQHNPVLLLVALKGDAKLEVPTQLMRTFFAGRIANDVDRRKAGKKLGAADAEPLQQEALDRVIDETLPTYVAAHEIGRYFQPEGDHYKVTASIRRGQVFVNDQLWQGAVPSFH